jgi:hypothetical protein
MCDHVCHMCDQTWRVVRRQGTVQPLIAQLLTHERVDMQACNLPRVQTWNALRRQGTVPQPQWPDDCLAWGEPFTLPFSNAGVTSLVVLAARNDPVPSLR